MREAMFTASPRTSPFDPDHVPHVNADPDPYPPVRIERCILFVERSLNLNGAAGRIESTIELDEERVTNGLDLASPEPLEDGAEKSIVAIEGIQRGCLVDLSERRIAHHIGEHDCGKVPLAHCHRSRTRASQVKRFHALFPRFPHRRPMGSALSIGRRDKLSSRPQRL